MVVHSFNSILNSFWYTFQCSNNISGIHTRNYCRKNQARKKVNLVSPHFLFSFSFHENLKKLKNKNRNNNGENDELKKMKMKLSFWKCQNWQNGNPTEPNGSNGIFNCQFIFRETNTIFKKKIHFKKKSFNNSYHIWIHCWLMDYLVKNVEALDVELWFQLI